MLLRYLTQVIPYVIDFKKNQQRQINYLIMSIDGIRKIIWNLRHQRVFHHLTIPSRHDANTLNHECPK